ncbi:hypothetical protein P170DRAFT_501112 [Aspergillus steynii IBT 23096]|uniref:Uncharacterized protein n=1 Tax=Aspergillus steynii IBT 23096 TaxID=1392250 RepID=A0A2I2FZZ6_9EURO|nr:uncharacterized protein P170DRAFT_501112 [Aspergillus steynii IBT 23096]PLB46193.1 hypothetical protein P170DRAFT_501112 [Aspergillus steynii IBT 23096]
MSKVSDLAFENLATEDAGKEQPPSSLSAISYIKHNEMITRSIQEWGEGIINHKEALSDWFVTKIEHMKNFHFSAVLHEVLKVSIAHLSNTTKASNNKEEAIIFIERMADCDQVTVGWTKIDHPPLTPWWIVRLLRGYFSDPTEGGMPVLRSSCGSMASAQDLWRAKGYSALDYLCGLSLNNGGIPLPEFSKILIETNKEAPVYDAVEHNCFWYARSVYLKALEGWQPEEHRGGYFKHMGKFAGMRTKLAVVIAQRMKIRNPVTKQIEKDEEEERLLST